VNWDLFAQTFKQGKYLLYKWSFAELLIFLIWVVTMQALKRITIELL